MEREETSRLEEALSLSEEGGNLHEALTIQEDHVVNVLIPRESLRKTSQDEAKEKFAMSLGLNILLRLNILIVIISSSAPNCDRNP